ncbi:transporter substrate-binding domain-containing protein [Erwinia sp. ErVv1]|uniref:ATP-binding protein n=1 Tax=Erwinia sp. ErVv1 TaxID=1603299 RepID=UPI0009ED2395|nr:transporter substrate-binding domain-containing protein [Erwinia sp. ErVv1]
MQKLHLFLITLFFLMCSSFAAESPYNVEIKGHYITPVKEIRLNRDQARWLEKKDRLLIGIAMPDVLPLLFHYPDDDYQGVLADYLFLLRSSLRINVVIKKYGSQALASAALQNNEVDALLILPDSNVTPGKQFQRTHALMTFHPTLVAAQNRALPLPLSQSRERVTVAVHRSYPAARAVAQNFPKAILRFYDNEHQALLSVATGESDYFLGYNVTASYNIEKYFPQSLTIVRYLNRQQRGVVFLTRTNQPQLHEVLNRFISAISNEQHDQLAQYWLERGNLSFLNNPLSLTAREKSWIKAHPRLRVLINRYYPPLSMVDQNNTLRGVSADLLNIISLQTGLQFEPVAVNSNEEMRQKMLNHEGDLIAAATLSEARQTQINFSLPWIRQHYVVVSPLSVSPGARLEQLERIAIPLHFAISEQLKARYPHAKWILADNSSMALSMVVEGSADAAVTTEITANYLVSRYYPQNLHYAPLSDIPSALVGIATSRQEPELQSILNKALQVIPPREILQMVGKWSKMPNVEIETWNLYSKPFYLMLTVAAFIFLLIVFWGYFLLHKFHKRGQSERELQQRLANREAFSQCLEAEKNRAIHATQAKSQFLASMSHEIRTPVSSIVGFLELLSRQHLTPQQSQEAIELATATAQSLLGLIGNILDVDKIETGNYQCEAQWTDVAALIGEICRTFDIKAADKDIALTCSMQLLPGIQLLLDPHALRRIVTNLVCNALKFTAQGCVAVSAKLISAKGTSGRLALVIRDTGCGIDEEEQKRLFHRYVQGEEGRQQIGSGLGLVICRELVSLMAGTLEMESTPGQGTTLTIILPVEIAEAAPVSARCDRPMMAPLPALSILIADDNPVNRLLLKRQLNALGYEVDEARDGEEAEQLCLKKRYHLLITDLNMPKRDGLMLTQALRGQQADLVIWGLTASALPQVREACLQSGMNECLFKPLSLENLAQALCKLPSEQPLVPDTQHVKISLLNANTQGNRALTDEILTTFRREAAKDLVAAKRAAEQDDRAGFKRAIHRLHGSAQILEIDALQRCCRDVEEKSPSQLTRPVRNAIIAEVSRIVQELEAELARRFKIA